MNAEAWWVLVVVVVTFVVLARDLAPASATLMTAAIVLLVTRVLDVGQTFAGFANPAPVTIAALYVVAGAVQQTSVLETGVGALLGQGRGHRRPLARLSVATAASSAFLNNTPIVAMLAPAVASWAERHHQPGSRYLMPVSYAAILGGVVTAIGTSTNLVVSGLLVTAGQEPLALFELTRVGLPLAAGGVALMVALAPRLLPDRRATLAVLDEESREFTVTMEVVPGGPLDGRTIEAGGLRALQGVYCVRIERDGRAIAPVAPTEVLQGGDELLFAGRVDRVVDLQRNRGLRSTEQHHLQRLDGGGHEFFEAVVGPSSPLIGSTVKDLGFRGRYGAAVLAIHRAGERLEGKVGECELRVGDTLLLLADSDFQRRWRDAGDFLLVAGTGQPAPIRPRQARITGVVVVAIVLFAGLELVPILEASLVAAVLLVGLRVLSVAQARASVDIDVLVVIAAAFAIGNAIEVSGLAGAIASALLGVTAPFGALGALTGVLLVTMAFTELLTNNAAAVLAFPIATATAAQVGANARPFAIAVAIGASLSFLTPIGYQTNLMVYGIGGYRFGDFARLGAPITAFVVVASVLLIPVGWPLHP